MLNPIYVDHVQNELNNVRLKGTVAIVGGKEWVAPPVCGRAGGLARGNQGRPPVTQVVDYKGPLPPLPPLHSPLHTPRPTMTTRVQTAIDVKKAIDGAHVLTKIGFDASVLEHGYYAIKETI